MASRLEQDLLAFETGRRALVEAVSGVDESGFEVRMKPDSWSLIQVMEHLVIAERDVLQGLPDLAAMPRRRRRWRSYLSYPAVLFILRSGITVPVASSTMAPRGDRSWPELREAWDENAAWLAGYVDGLTEAERRNAPFVHPMTGPLPVKQTLKLLRVHFNSHQRELRKLLAGT